ncbi:MAG: hypothetical protein HGB32_10785 [Geobacteraceae bacterium]|nr:hypothetical protein [Geobacteraceae bacterium]NTW80621.1 hypothetical protein [Geobacteraceae bacterium]
MPARKKEIIETLKLIQENEPLDSDDFMGKIDLSVVLKLYAAEYIVGDILGDGATKNKFTNLRIRINGIMLLDDLEVEAITRSLKGKILPVLSKFLWIVVGASLAFIFQILLKMG